MPVRFLYSAQVAIPCQFPGFSLRFKNLFLAARSSDSMHAFTATVVGRPCILSPVHSDDRLVRRQSPFASPCNSILTICSFSSSSLALCSHHSRFNRLAFCAPRCMGISFVSSQVVSLSHLVPPNPTPPWMPRFRLGVQQPPERTFARHVRSPSGPERAGFLSYGFFLLPFLHDGLFHPSILFPISPLLLFLSK